MTSIRVLIADDQMMVREGFSVRELVRDAEGRVTGIKGKSADGAAVEERLHRDEVAKKGVPADRIPRWLLWARLPLQPLMMLWAWRATAACVASRSLIFAISPR